jgi:cell division protein FtsL
MLFDIDININLYNLLIYIILCIIFIYCKETITHIYELLTEINSKISNHDKSIEDINNKIINHDKLFEDINSKLSNHNKSIENINSKISNHDKLIILVLIHLIHNS